MRIAKIGLFVLVAGVMVAGCATQMVSVTSANSLSDVGDAGIVSVKFNPRLLPTLPLVDAGLYSNGVNDVLDSLMAIEDELAPDITRVVMDRVDTANRGSVTIIEADASGFDWMELDQSWAGELAQEHGVEAVVVPKVRVATTSVGTFGITGANRLEMALYVVSADGEIIALGRFITPTQVLGPKDLDGYRDLIANTYEQYTNMLFDAVLMEAQ